jgi:uncharacterized RDD family membrane protein YckC
VAARPAPPIAAPPAPRPAPPSPAPAAARPQPPAPAPVASPAASSQGVSSPPPPAIAAEPAADASEVAAEPASLWRRLLAFAIDAAVVLGVWWLFLLAASAVIGVQPQPSHLTGIDALMLELHAYQPVMLPGAVLGILLAGSYCAAFAFLRQGRTLGRWALGLRLVDARGSAPTPVRAVVRAVLAVVSFALFLVGFWIALFDRRGQTLHDKLTATFVVRPL